jgi:hypothetical protein
LTADWRSDLKRLTAHAFSFRACTNKNGSRAAFT